jgi:hypothetical protein
VLHEHHTLVVNGLGVLSGPNLSLGLFQHWAPVLDYELELRIEPGELQAEAP